MFILNRLYYFVNSFRTLFSLKMLRCPAKKLLPSDDIQPTFFRL